MHHIYSYKCCSFVYFISIDGFLLCDSQSDLGCSVTYIHSSSDLSTSCFHLIDMLETYDQHFDVYNRLVVASLYDGILEYTIPLNLLLFEDDRMKFMEHVVPLIQKGIHNHVQCFVSVQSYNLLFSTHGDRWIVKLDDNRFGPCRVILNGMEEEWLKEYVVWYSDAVSEQELDETGSIYIGWIGLHMEMIPLRVFVGSPIATPTFLGHSVVNPRFNDNKCLQRCLILASIGGKVILASRNHCKSSVYSAYWKNPNKHRVFDHSIHEIEAAVGIQNNKPFVDSDSNFRTLENLLCIRINCWEIVLLNGFDSDTKDLDGVRITPKYLSVLERGQEVNLAILYDLSRNIKHFIYVKDLASFKVHISRPVDCKNYHKSRLSKCRFCDFVAAFRDVQCHEVIRHPEKLEGSERYELPIEKKRLSLVNQHYSMPAPVVVYTNFKSCMKQIQYIPIKLSCLTVSRISAVQNEMKVFHVPKESESNLCLFIDYLFDLRDRIVEYLVNEFKLKRNANCLNDYNSTQCCLFCGCNMLTRKKWKSLEKSERRNKVYKVKHHAHVSAEYHNGKITQHYEAAEYICTCCNKCNLQLSFNKHSYRIPVELSNFSYITELISRYSTLCRASSPCASRANDTTDYSILFESISTVEDKEMVIELNGIQFKDLFMNLYISLKNSVHQTRCKDISIYKYTKDHLMKYCHERHIVWNDSYIDIVVHKEPVFMRAIPNELRNKYISDDDYSYMELLWDTFHIHTWNEYYEWRNILNVTLLADSFEFIRDTMLNSFGIDPAHYTSLSQMSYSLFLKITMTHHNEEHLHELAEEWASYETRINANEGLKQQQLEQVFVDRMNEFYLSGGIKLMDDHDIDDFIRLKNNLRDGVKQVVKRHAKIDRDKSTVEEGIFFLKADNIYCGTMHRLLPYELVKPSEDLERINMDPDKWILSLQTFGQFGYFIECDIELPNELHDFFNDLPLFPQNVTNIHSSDDRGYGRHSGVSDTWNNSNTKTLICTLGPKKQYLVHYSMLQLGVKLGYHVSRIYHIIKFKQAPFAFEFVNLLLDKCRNSTSTLEKNLYDLIRHVSRDIFVDTGLKRIVMKFAATANECEKIIQRYGIDMISSTRMYSNNLMGIKLTHPVKKVMKPFFIGFALLDMSKYIIYDFYYNKLKTTFNWVELIYQDVDSFIVHIKDSSTVNKMCTLYKSFDFSELDTSSYFYKQLVDYYYRSVSKIEFPSISSFLNFNKNISGPIFKDRHYGHRIIEYVGLRPKLYCIIDEHDAIHNAVKSSSQEIIMDNHRLKVDDVDSFERLFITGSQDSLCIERLFKQINNQIFSSSSVDETNPLLACTDNKRWIDKDNVHTLAYGHYRLDEIIKRRSQ